LDADLFSPDLAVKYHSDDVRIMETGKAEEVEERYLQEGREIWVNTIKTPVRNANGEIVGLLGVFWDITERKRAVEEVHRLNAELEQRVSERTAQLEAANKELEAFSYSVSHDLRAPLRGIDGWSHALEEDYGDKLDEQGRVFLAQVRDEAQRMGQLIDDLLDLSRVTRAEMRRETVDLSALAGCVVAGLRKYEPQRQVEINIAPGLTAAGDSRLLRQALENLLGNAWKFTGKKAEARIEVGVMEKWSNGVMASSQNPNTPILQHSNIPVFFVRDNGAGFNMAHAKKLFAPFQRLHRPSEFPGTGIGLATVQRIIFRHGGEVWAKAELDQGATFHFTLPAGKG
jgi:signal transduction histidine kinase